MVSDTVLAVCCRILLLFTCWKWFSFSHAQCMYFTVVIVVSENYTFVDIDRDAETLICEHILSAKPFFYD